MRIFFENPYYLFSLFILPFIVFTHFYMLKYKKMTAMKFANFETLKRIDEHWVFSKNVLQLFLRLAFTLVIILAFSGVRFGYNTEGSDYNLIFAIDNSGSMLAKDLDPTRFSAVKDITRDYLSTITTGATVGLVSFGGMAFIVEEPTEEFNNIIESVESLSVSSIPGTAIGDAIKTSVTLLETIDNDQSGMIVLMTDGQENVLKEEELFSIVDYASSKHVLIHIIGIGSEKGDTSELVEEGSIFTLNVDTLAGVANNSGGIYLEAGSREELTLAIDTIISPQEITRTVPLGPVLFVIAIMIMFIEWNFSNYHFRRFP